MNYDKKAKVVTKTSKSKTSRKTIREKKGIENSRIYIFIKSFINSITIFFDEVINSFFTFIQSLFETLSEILTLKFISEKISLIRTLIVNLSIILAVILFCVYTYRQLQKEIIIIEPVSVPEEMKKNGYTERVLAQMLMDKITYIHKTTKLLSQRHQYTTAWIKTPLDMEIPGSGVSVKSLMEIIRPFFGGHSTTVVSEIILNEKSLKIVLRIDGEIETSYIGESQSLDSLFVKSAKYVYKHTNPYLLLRYLRDVDSNECISTIKYLLENKPKSGHYDYYSMWGWCLNDQEKYDDAVTKFKKALALNPDDASSYNGLGWTFFEQNKYDNAIENFKKAIEIDPWYANAYRGWGSALNAKKKYNDAIVQYKQAVDIDSTDTDITSIYNEWGLALYFQKKYNDAIQQFQKALEIDSTYIGSYYWWGWSLIKLKKYEEAVQKFRKALEFDSLYANAYNGWGWTLYEEKRYEDAIQKFQEAIKLNPMHDYAYEGWGLVLYKQKKYNEAIHKFQRVLEIDSTYASTYSRLGLTLYELKKYEEAIQKFRKALEFDSSYANAYNGWGEVLYQQKKYDEAIQKFQKAVKIDSLESSGVYRLWGNVLRATKQNDEAMIKYQKAIEIDPQNGIAYFDWGLLLENSEKYEEALVKFEKVIELDPKNYSYADSARVHIDKIKQNLVSNQPEN